MRATAGQTFTLIVPFEVPEGQEAIFHKQWQEIVESASNVKGSLGPGLYEANANVEGQLHSFFSPQTGEGLTSRAHFRFVNVAEWESVKHYETAIHSLRQVKPISFPGHGAYYHIIEELRGLHI
jgi:hypothetical protein